MNANYWENLLFQSLNDQFKETIFEEIYLPAAQVDSSDGFNIHADIRLKNWIDNVLPSKTIEVGWQVLSGQFLKILQDRFKDAYNQHRRRSETGEGCSDQDLFKSLKEAVSQEVLARHKWDSKANDVLKLIQTNASEDRIIAEKEKWLESARYLQNNIIDRICLSKFAYLPNVFKIMLSSRQTMPSKGRFSVPSGRRNGLIGLILPKSRRRIRPSRRNLMFGQARM